MNKMIKLYILMEKLVENQTELRLAFSFDANDRDKWLKRKVREETLDCVSR